MTRARDWFRVRVVAHSTSLTLSAMALLIQRQDNVETTGQDLAAGAARVWSEFGHKLPAGLRSGFSVGVSSLSLSLKSVHQAVVLFNP